MIWFVLQTVVVIAGLYALPALGNLREQVGQIGVAATAAVISAALFFLWDFLRAPAHMDAEKTKLIEAQASALEEAGARSKPRLVIGRLMQKTGDPVHYLEVTNPSPTEPLSECFARLEYVTDTSGVEIHSHIPLRVENQTDRRFNLDAEQTKRIPLLAPGTGSTSFRILRLEGNGPKLPHGDYSLLIHITTNKGGSPAKARVTIKGSKVAVTSTGDPPNAKPAI